MFFFNIFILVFLKDPNVFCSWFESSLHWSNVMSNSQGWGWYMALSLSWRSLHSLTDTSDGLILTLTDISLSACSPINDTFPFYITSCWKDVGWKIVIWFPLKYTFSFFWDKKADKYPVAHSGCLRGRSGRKRGTSCMQLGTGMQKIMTKRSPRGHFITFSLLEGHVMLYLP